MLPRAVVFDLDGTLIDSAADVSTILNGILREEGVTTLSPSHVKVLMGKGASALIRRALQVRGICASERELRRLTARFSDLYSSSP